MIHFDVAKFEKPLQLGGIRTGTLERTGTILRLPAGQTARPAPAGGAIPGTGRGEALLVENPRAADACRRGGTDTL